MKKNINTGEKVINYLASCGKEEVDMLDLVEAVVPGCHDGEEMDEAFGSILPVLTNLESGGLIRLSTEAIPSTGFVPRLISILPKMKNAADRLMQGQTGGSSEGRPQKGGKAAAEIGEKVTGVRERRADAISSKFYAFAELFEKKRKMVRIRGEWNRLVSSMIYSDIEEETGFQACVKAFVNGLIWQRRIEQIGPGSGSADKQEKEEPRLQPGLLSKIDEIIRADEEKNGTLRAGRKGRRVAGEADAPLVRLDRGEIKDFMHCIHNMRDEIQPGRLWRDAVSRFIAEQLERMPVYEACMESFKAGIIWQMNRKKLES
jgi:hypothetical protein